MNRNFSGFKLNHMELICKALFCQPNDLLQWMPDKNEILADNHPLQKMKQEETYDNWQKTLATIPLEQLKEVAKTIERKN